jgi:hypothetical protein
MQQTKTNCFDSYCTQAVVTATGKIRSLLATETPTPDLHFLHIIYDLALERLSIARQLNDPLFYTNFAKRFQERTPSLDTEQSPIPTWPKDRISVLAGQSVYGGIFYQDGSDSLHTQLLEKAKGSTTPENRADVGELNNESVLGHKTLRTYNVFSESEWEQVKQSNRQPLHNTQAQTFRETAEHLAFRAISQFLEQQPNIHAREPSIQRPIKITTFFQLDPKNNGPLTKISEAIAFPVRLSNPPERQLTPFTIIHQNPSSIEDTMDTIGKTFEELALLHRTDQRLDQNEFWRQALSSIAKIRYLYAHAMPWTRGSASIGEMMETSLIRALGAPQHPLVTKSRTDIDALTSPYSQFLEKYIQKQSQTIFSSGRERL